MSTRKTRGEWSSTPRARRNRKPLTLTLSESALASLKEVAENGLAEDWRHPGEDVHVFKSQSAVVEWLIETYL